MNDPTSRQRHPTQRSPGVAYFSKKKALAKSKHLAPLAQDIVDVVSTAAL